MYLHTRYRRITEKDYRRIADLYFWEFCGNPNSAAEIMENLTEHYVYGYLAEAYQEEDDNDWGECWQIVGFCFINENVGVDSCNIHITSAKEYYDFEVQALVTHVRFRNMGVCTDLLRLTMDDLLQDFPKARIVCRAFGYPYKSNAYGPLIKSKFKKLVRFDDIYDKQCPVRVEDPNKGFCGVDPRICGGHCSMAIYQYGWGDDDAVQDELRKFIHRSDS